MNEMNREYTRDQPPPGSPFLFHILFFILLLLLNQLKIHLPQRYCLIQPWFSDILSIYTSASF